MMTLSMIRCVFGLICLASGVLACGPQSPSSSQPSLLPPANFSEADLVGTWQAIYGGSDTDSITIEADGMFRQVFTTPYGYHYESSANQWWIEKRPSGCIYLHLSNMRYYAGTIEKAEGMANGVPVHLIEVCENRVLEVSTELVLAVTSADTLPRGIRLAQLKADADTNDVYFILISPLATETAESQP